MRVKKIGAILAGAVMIGSAVAAAWDPSLEKDFFVDPETGEPNAIVVVGANAAASDVTAGAWVAAQIGSMAYYEEVTTTAITETWKSPKPFYDDYGDNFMGVTVPLPPVAGQQQDDNGSNNADAILVGDATWGYFSAGIPYGEISTLWWEDWDNVLGCPAFKTATYKTVGYGVLNEWEKREEIYINLTHDWQAVKDGLIGFQYIYPIVPAGPFYGFEYRTILEHFPDPIIWFGGQFNYAPYYLYEDANNIKFLCDYYDLLSWGTDTAYGDYILYGTPHWSEEECRSDEKWIFEVGETKEFYGWEVTLKDIGIYENKVIWAIKGPTDEEPCEYPVVLSGLWPDLSGDFLGSLVYDPPETVTTAVEYYEWLRTSKTYQGAGLAKEAAWNVLIDEGYFPERCYASVQKVYCEYDVIGITDTLCDVKDVTVFALDTIKTMVGAEGTNVAVCRLYALEDYGIIHDAVCIQPCGTEGYQWALDIDLGNYDIEYGDAGDLAVPYIDPLTGTPNYYSDGLNDDYPNVSGTEPIPDFRDGVTEIFISLKLMNLIDIRVCGSAQTIPLCCFDIPQCGVDDYWVNTGDAPVYVELTIDDSGDLAHTDLIVQGGFTVTHYSGETIESTIQLVDIDPMSIVVNDDEVTDTMKASSNLVLVGGPGLVVCVGAEPQVANTLTQELVDQGLSTVNWVASIGEYEYIANAFADGKDVVIVAGADREATRHAVENLLNDLNA